MSADLATERRSPLMVQLGGLYGLWLREVKRAFRDRGQLIGGVSRPIESGLAVGLYDDTADLLRTIERYLVDGYKRVKNLTGGMLGWKRDVDPAMTVK